ncbi:hypothetical protein [Streptomyces sp. NBC_01320]|uniref:hypothetical protein n=1 Tax=Streptomyces sp. NBC_01320 TaxID=2903824 RepID=UPI002E104D11|nr:hypothetical protein OG395_27265 [Streptomyces sp. NBC_01320]
MQAAVLKNISVVLTPDWSDVVYEENGRTITRRSDEEIDRFADEMQQNTRAIVTVADYSTNWERLQESIFIGNEGLLDLIAQEPAATAHALLSRTVLIDAWNSIVPGVAEDFQLAAVVDSRRYFKWRTEPENEYGGGLYGRKSVVDAFGGSWKPSPVFETQHYCYFQHDAFLTLPAVLAGYAKQYVTLINRLGETSGM